MKRWAMLGLMLLLLCGCGKQTISLPEAQQPDREPKPSASEGSGETAQVQKENTENDTDSAETDASGKAYQQEYFTNEAASDVKKPRKWMRMKRSATPCWNMRAVCIRTIRRIMQN